MSALTFLTRYNNIGFSLIWALIFILEGGGLKSIKNSINILISGLTFTGMIGIFKIFPETYNQHVPYQKTINEGYLSVHGSLGKSYSEFGTFYLGLIGG